MLPEYCQDLIAARFQAHKKWEPVLGPTVKHLHHYCLGLTWMMRAQRAFSVPEQERMSRWGKAVDEITYSINSATPDFVLLPELHYKRGISYQNVKRPKEAEADFRKSIETLATYYVAYAALAELYRKNGRNDLARDVVAKGLNHSPDSKQLLRLQQELGRTGGSGTADRKAGPRRSNDEPNRLDDPDKEKKLRDDKATSEARDNPK